MAIRVSALALSVVGTPAICLSEESDQGSPVAAPPPAAGKFRDPEDGQIDLSTFLAKPRAFLPIPLVITEPAVGYGGGLAGMFIRPRTKAGGEGFARPNISAVGGFATENGTNGAFGADASRWFDDRVKTLLGGGTGKINLDFYGLGLDDESLDEPVRYSLDFSLVLLQGSWRLEADSPWSLGLRYVYSNVEPRLRDEPQFPGLADGIRVEVSAPAVIVEFDSRDNLFTPTRGTLSESTLSVFSEAFGGSQDFQLFQQVLIHHWRLSENLFLGGKGELDLSFGDTPFYARPYIALRGLPALRYQGEHVAAGELELRWQFHPRFSAVGFGGGGVAWTDLDAFEREQGAVSGGVGGRYVISRLFGLHAGLDVACGPEGGAIYVVFGNSWMRP